jgi:hypothetical protein
MEDLGIDARAKTAKSDSRLAQKLAFVCVVWHSQSLFKAQLAN